MLVLLLAVGCGTPGSPPAPVDPPADVAAPVPPAPAEPVAPSTGLPAGLQGRWGMSPADCEVGRDDAKGLLTITADALRFYEARGVPEAVTTREEHRFEAVFAYTGEGQTWTRTEVLTVTGDTLTRKTDGEPGATGPWSYTRCPG